MLSRQHKAWEEAALHGVMRKRLAVISEQFLKAGERRDIGNKW